jgi:hypothetical protein
MRKPSIKTLSRIFEDAKTARAIFEMSRAQLLETETGKERAAECHNPPKTYDIRMECLNHCGGFHGVEGIETASGGEWVTYLNTGDSYADTVIFWRGKYRVQSVGDFIEKCGVALK